MCSEGRFQLSQRPAPLTVEILQRLHGLDDVQSEKVHPTRYVMSSTISEVLEL